LSAGSTVGDLGREFITQWFDRFLEAVNELAESNGYRVKDYACTLSAAIIGTEQAVFIQVGDGTIVVSQQAEPGEYGWVFWPEKGDYENETVFLTSPNAQAHIQFESHVRRYDEVAIFTDGLQRLALQLANQAAHAPFFRGVFHPLVKEQEGHAAGLSQHLAEFLGSPRINDRTDDDKTLIIATRRTTQPRVGKTLERDEDEEQAQGI
jgi:hypothetical protein